LRIMMPQAERSYDPSIRGLRNTGPLPFHRVTIRASSPPQSQRRRPGYPPRTPTPEPRRPTKSTALNKDSKSAIYHYFRCQIAKTLNVPEQNPRTRYRAYRKSNLGKDVEACDLRVLSAPPDASVRACGVYSRDPLRR